MMVTQIHAGPMANCSYLAGEKSRGECVLIDLGWEPEKIEAEAGKLGMKITAILLTHGHFDHSQAVKGFAERKSLPVYVEKNDLKMLKFSSPLLKPFSGDTEIEAAGLKFRFIHTPGHTAGSCCILADGNIFTGDTLFINECGRVDLPESNPEQMYHSMVRLAGQDPKLTVWPGHAYGGTCSSIGAEIKSNPYLKLAMRGKDEFLEAMY